MNDLKLKVVRGFISPYDLAKKQDRRAVIMDDENGVVVVAPVTTYFSRSGTVPPGHVLIDEKSQSRAKAGFDKPQVLVSIRDIVRVAKDSPWFKGTQVIGHLDLGKDQRILRRFGEELRDFPIRSRVFD